MVIGRRRMSFYQYPLRFVGNKILNVFFSLIYQKHVPDLLSGFRILDVKNVKEIGIECSGFELETELTAKFLRNGLDVKWIPVSYDRRKGNSKFDVIRDTVNIIKHMIKMRI